MKLTLAPRLQHLLRSSALTRKAHAALRSASSSRKIKGHNNCINATEAFLFNCKIEVEGNNNRISIGQFTTLRKVRISLIGDNLKLSIGGNGNFGPGSEIVMRDNGGAMEIGNECRFGKVKLYVAEDDSQIHIGDDCMFSREVEVRCSDSHAIYDQQTRARINSAENIVIEDHVWVGLRCIILKGAMIGSGAVVGAGCVLAKAVPANSVVVGNPARVVRSGVVWTDERELDVLDNETLESIDGSEQ